MLPNCVESRTFKNVVYCICNSPTTICADSTSPGNTWSLDASINDATLDSTNVINMTNYTAWAKISCISKMSLGSSQAAPPPISLKSSINKPL